MWSYYFIVCLVLFSLFLTQFEALVTEDGPPPPELARQHGYRCEVHHVTTTDGYILQLHRLPGGKLNPLNSSLPPVIIMHGICATSADFFLAGPSQALSYLLADLGYDVWLPNSRGNTYSRQHVSLHADHQLFWDYSWHEVAVYDLPAIIDYILQVTGHESLLYVGHSMGTTIFFVLCSEKPEYNTKVQYMIALAPVAYLTYTTSIATLMLPAKDEVAEMIDTLSHGEMLSRTSRTVTNICSMCKMAHNQYWCSYLMSLLFGFDPAGTDSELVRKWFYYNPAGGSAKSLLHFAQIKESNIFQQFDHATEEENSAVYGSPFPPRYNLSRITVPMAFFCGGNDAMANPEDVNHLLRELNDVEVYRENMSSMNHVDFLLAKNVKELIYDQLKSLLETNQRLSNNTTCVV